MNVQQTKDWLESGKSAFIIKALQNLQAYLLQQGDLKEEKERINQILNQIPITTFLPCFDTTSHLQLNLIVSVFSKLIQEVNVEYSILNDNIVFEFLLKGYQHPFEHVRRLVMNQIKRCKFNVIFSKPETFAEILNRGMIDDEISVVKIVNDIIINNICGNEEGLNNFFIEYKNLFLEPLLNLLKNKNEIYKFRVYELMSKISGKSERAFNLIIENKIFNYFINELNENKNDILVLLNYLEIFKLFSLSSFENRGINYLSKEGGFKMLIDILLQNIEDTIIYSFILQLIADLSDKKEDLFFENNDDMIIPKVIIDKLFDEDLSNTNQKETQIVAVTVIATLCKGSRKVFQQVLLENSKHCVKYLSFLVDSLNDQLRRAFLHGFGSLLESNKLTDEDIDQFVGQLENNVLRKRVDLTNNSNLNISNSYLMNYLMYSLKEPFPETRCALYHVLKGMSTRIHLIRDHINNYPGFFDFITNRTTEPDKETREWKFMVVQVLYQTLHHFPNIANVDSKNIIDLKTYLLRGPYVADVMEEAQAVVASQYVD
ncbi:hypothetical protein ABK040_015488 [Willaertia magna]